MWSFSDNRAGKIVGIIWWKPVHTYASICLWHFWHWWIQFFGRDGEELEQTIWGWSGARNTVLVKWVGCVRGQVGMGAVFEILYKYESCYINHVLTYLLAYFVPCSSLVPTVCSVFTYTFVLQMWDWWNYVSGSDQWLIEQLLWPNFIFSAFDLHQGLLSVPILTVFLWYPLL